MKYLALFAVLAGLYTLGFGRNAEFYYWYRGEKQPLILKQDKTFLLLEREATKESLSDKLRVDNGKIEQIKKLAESKWSKQKDAKPRNNYWAIIKSGSEGINLSSSEIIYHGPFFKGANRGEVGLSHLFYVKLRSQEDKKILETMANEHRVEVLHNNEFRPLWYTLACNRGSAGNALEMANLFYETGFFAAAQPDLMPSSLFHSANDPYYGDQWGLANTGQYAGTPGEDIQVVDAWEITKSHSGISVAVNDEGVDPSHPDLPNIHSFSYDANSGTSPSQLHGDHGTAVAGIIAANTNNSEGIAGIAPQSLIMSISNLFGPGVDDELADGMEQARYNGASVINNSWGGGWPNQNIDDAIENAAVSGRNELGIAVVFSTGNNDYSWIGYPSSHPDAIAVGATSMCAERKSPGSCDTESSWGSNYGTGLDVVAPGVLIPTTDRQSTDGYNPYIPIHVWTGGTLVAYDYNNEDYTTWFDGTSAAAPHVSGIAALVLSINGSLTLQEVRNAIEGSAEKVGGYTYTLNAGERSGLTWNSEMGYGRVNAYRALIYTIANYGAHLGIEMSQVRLPLYNDLTLQQDVTLESGSKLTVVPKSTVTLDAGGSAGIRLSSVSSLTLETGATLAIAASSGVITIGGSGSLPKAAARGIAQKPKASPSGIRSLQTGIARISRITGGVEVSLRLQEDASVLIEAYDPAGRQVNLHKQAQRMSAGTHAVRMPLSGNNHGIIYLRIKAGNKVYQGIVPPL